MIEPSAFDLAYGQRLKEARVAAGLSQAELGRAVDLTRSSITNIEAGRQGTGAEMIVRLATVLAVSVQWLLTGSTALGKPLVSHRRLLSATAANLRDALAEIETALRGTERS
jgi:transcriptional regulator with XRE-family HTH domain